MQSHDVNGLPFFPTPPAGILRRGHLPTVAASLRYWEAVRRRAIRAGDRGLERTATGLRLSYEAARRELIVARWRSTGSRSDPREVVLG
jgi:hypothetical protein